MTACLIILQRKRVFHEDREIEMPKHDISTNFSNIKTDCLDCPPKNPVEGQMYYNKIDGHLYIYNKKEWVEVIK